jgi:hypothetical protein
LPRTTAPGFGRTTASRAPVSALIIFPPEGAAGLAATVGLAVCLVPFDDEPQPAATSAAPASGTT